MNTLAATLRGAVAGAWLRVLFWSTLHAPWLVTCVRPLAVRAAWWLSPSVRDATRANARWLLGPSSTLRERSRLGRRVLGSFYDAVIEFASNRRADRASMLARLESVSGEEAYRAARAAGRGAVLVTAHLGSFETAIGMLVARENRVHVIFRRDESRDFERLRSEQHARWGVMEAPTADGLPMWVRMRDALRADDVVLMQGDRTGPGEKGVTVVFLGGHMRLPAGPAKLARAAGAPLVPVFAVKGQGLRPGVQITIGEPLWPEAFPGSPGEPDPLVLRFGMAIERFVARYPDQWLVLHRAWCEDQPSA